MNDKIASWLAPPIFEDNNEKTWRASLLNTTLLILILFDIVIIIGNLLGEDMPITIFIIDGIILVTCLLLRRILFSGRVKLTGVLLLATLFILVTAAMSILGTIRTPTTSLFLLLIIIAGLLFGRNGTIIMVVSSSLATVSLIIAENAGILPSPDYTVNITQGITFTLLFGLIGLLIYLVHKTTSHSLEQQFKEVAAHKQTMVALQASEKRYRGLSDGVPIGLYRSTPQGQIMEANPALVRMMGYRDRQSLLKIRIPDLYADPQDHQHAKTLLQQNGTIHGMDVQLRRSNGETFWVRDVVRIVRGADGEALYYEGSLEDITERKQAEKMLHQYERILSATDSHMAFLDQNYIYQAVNDVYLQIHQLTRQDIIGHSVTELLGADVFEMFVKEKLDRCLAGEKVHYQEWFDFVKLGRRYMDVYYSPYFDANGEITGVTVSSHDSTIRKQAEIALQKERDFAESLINTAQTIVLVLDVEGRIVRFNPYMEEFSGYALAEVQGKDWFSTFLPEEEQERIRALFSTAVNNNQTKGYINVIVTKNGSERKIEWHDKTLLDADGNVEGLLTVGQDITEREQAATALQLEQERLNNILDSIEDGIYIVNQQFDIQYINPVIRREFGAINNRKCYTYFHDRIDVCPWCKNDEILAGKSVHWEWYSHKNNKHYDLFDTPFINQDGSISKFEILHDITKRKQAEEALLAAKDAAEAANRAKSAFLSNMSHELRTPLNGILGYTQLFKRDATLTPDQQQGVDIIHSSGEHLLMMINDILDISKIEADRIELVPIELEFPHFLKTIGSMMRVPAEQKGLTFNYQPEPNLPKAVLADETRLRQILLNLLNNAVKFTEQGEVTLRVQRHKHGAVCQIRFEVEDSGVGIPQEQQASIFEPFHQVGDGQVKHQGTGLGLAISQRLVRMMGGELHVESGGKTAVGSRFWFDLTLPLITATESIKTSVMRSEIGYTRTTSDPMMKTSPFKILLVDDLAENRMVLNALLTPLGFTIVEADGGLDAIAKTTQFKPDLILMDLVMPNVDGLEATRQIRQQPDMMELPIIAISANVNETVQQESIDAGCNLFLPKPFSTKLLLAKLEQYLPLEWYYEADDTIARMGHVQSSDLETEIPSKMELNKMLNLIMIGDINGIKKRLSVLEKEGNQYSFFVAQLNRLVAGFRMDEIEQYIKETLVNNYDQGDRRL